MFKKFIRILFTLIGAGVGYGIFILARLWVRSLGNSVSGEFTHVQTVSIAIIFSLIFALIFFRMTPFFLRQGTKAADNIGKDLNNISATDLVSGVIGLITGLIIAFLLSQIFSGIGNRYVYSVISLLLYLFLGYLGVVVANKKGKEIFSQVVITAKREPSKTEGRQGKQHVKGKKKGEIFPKILDTSVIIDGRIAEILKTGFLEGPIIIPEFVLVELRHIADSSDSLKRVRGRRGLDILNKIQTEHGIEIYNTDNEKTLKDIPEVDVKLIKLGQLMKGKVVTNDYNLNKVAKINGVSVLNINELANTLKPIVIPGESMEIALVKEGKDGGQGIGYLDDGTMIVVDDGKRKIGKTVRITVTSVLQTDAGRMIFGKLK